MTSEKIVVIGGKRPYGSLRDLAAERLALMMRCYPGLQIGDGEVFLAGMLTVLCLYSPQVIIAVTEPTGLPSREKWPSIAGLRALCDEEAAARSGPRRSYADAVEETLGRREADLPRLTGPSGRDVRTRHIGEVLRKYGFLDIAKKFDAP